MVNTVQRPLILAVETSSRIGSVALALGADVLAQTLFSAPFHHSREIFPSIGQLLKRFGCQPDDIRQVHVAIGPGSFTGLRIAATLAKTMHLAQGVQVVTVDTLDAIAANVSDALPANGTAADASYRLAALLDAKRGQFFAAVYEWGSLDQARDNHSTDEAPPYRIAAPCHGLWRKIQADCLMSEEQLLKRFAVPDRPLYLVGDGLLYHQDAFRDQGVCLLDERLWSPRAAMVHRLGYQKAQAGLFSDPPSLAPFYLRGPQVTVKRIA
jgi:tRNA threonylcarbamoyl adenosine modification protein YeaZ